MTSADKLLMNVLGIIGTMQAGPEAYDAQLPHLQKLGAEISAHLFNAKQPSAASVAWNQFKTARR